MWYSWIQTFIYNILYIYYIYRYIPQIYHFTSHVFFIFVGQNPHKKLRIQRLLRCVCQLLGVPSLLVLLWNGEDITKKSDEFPWDLGTSWGNSHGKNCELTPRTPWIQIGRPSFQSDWLPWNMMISSAKTGVFRRYVALPKGINLINPQESVCYPLVVLSPAGCTPVLVYIYGYQSLSVPWSSHWTC